MTAQTDSFQNICRFKQKNNTFGEICNRSAHHLDLS